MKYNQWFYYIVVTAVWSVYVYFTFQAPQTSSNVYNLSQLQMTLLRLSVAIPYLIIWLIALYGVLRFQHYVNAIRQESDGKALSKIGVGLWILFLSMLLTALLSASRTFFQVDPRVMTIINNYANVYPLLVSMVMIYGGSRQLMSQIKGGTLSRAGKLTIFVGLGLFSICYLWLIFTNPTRENSSDPALRATYYLPDILIITTIVIPSFVAWSLGLLAALKIKTYAQKVSGIIYKQALAKFVVGIFAVVGASILLQALLSAGSERLLGLGLGLILVIVYIFLIAQSVGFIFIAMGAKKLSQIEEVGK